MCRSIRMRSKGSSHASVTASAPSAASTGTSSRDSSSAEISIRFTGLSSTTSTRTDPLQCAFGSTVRLGGTADDCPMSPGRACSQNPRTPGKPLGARGPMAGISLMKEDPTQRRLPGFAPPAIAACLVTHVACRRRCARIASGLNLACDGTPGSWVHGHLAGVGRVERLAAVRVPIA